MHNLRYNYTHLIRVCVDISIEIGIAFIASKLRKPYSQYVLHTVLNLVCSPRLAAKFSIYFEGYI